MTFDLFSGTCTSPNLNLIFWVPPSQLQFNLRFKFCAAPFQLPLDLTLYEAFRWWLLAVRRHPEMFPQSANELYFMPLSRGDKVSGGGGPLRRARLVRPDGSWRDKSWQKHSLGHEHWLPCLRNQPIVAARSLWLKFIGITWNYASNNCLLQRQRMRGLAKVTKTRSEQVKVETQDTWPDKFRETRRLLASPPPASHCTGANGHPPKSRGGTLRLASC